MSSIKFCPDYSVVSSEIKAQMARRGITQSQLAKRIAVCQPTVHNRLSHAATFTLSELVRATGVLGLSITIENGEIKIN